MYILLKLSFAINNSRYMTYIGYNFQLQFYIKEKHSLFTKRINVKLLFLPKSNVRDCRSGHWVRSVAVNYSETTHDSTA